MTTPTPWTVDIDASECDGPVWLYLDAADRTVLVEDRPQEDSELPHTGPLGERVHHDSLRAWLQGRTGLLDDLAGIPGVEGIVCNDPGGTRQVTNCLGGDIKLAIHLGEIDTYADVLEHIGQSEIDWHATEIEQRVDDDLPLTIVGCSDALADNADALLDGREIFDLLVLSLQRTADAVPAGNRNRALQALRAEPML